MKEAITADLNGERRTGGGKLAVQDVPAKGHVWLGWMGGQEVCRS